MFGLSDLLTWLAGLKCGKVKLIKRFFKIQINNLIEPFKSLMGNWPPQLIEHIALFYRIS